MHKLNIAIACGGTGGHIFPGLSVAEEFINQGHNVTLWLSGKDIEAKSIDNWKGNIIIIPSEGFQFGFSLKSISTIFKLIKSFLLAIPRMKKNSPDILLAMGSYASFGPVMAARFLRIPYVLHESNTIPGRAVSFLSKKSSAVAISFKETEQFLTGINTVYTGMPLRSSIQKELVLRKNKNNNDMFTILVMGGSRGAKLLNDIIPLSLNNLTINKSKIKIIHIAGLNPLDELKNKYIDIGINYELHKFIPDIGKYYNKSDLVICRSGASTCAELLAFNKKSLLIPYPHAIRDHQYHNAKALEKLGLAKVFLESELKQNNITDYIQGLIFNQNTIEDNSKFLHNIDIIDAHKNVVNLLKNIIEK